VARAGDPGARLDLAVGRAHLGAIEVLPSLFPWLTADLERSAARR
jgi:hypothetical protein